MIGLPCGEEIVTKSPAVSTQKNTLLERDGQTVRQNSYMNIARQLWWCAIKRV